MRKLTLALATSTLVFGASTVYFAREAQRLRQEQRVPDSPVASTPSGVHSASTPAAVVPQSPVAAEATAPTTPTAAQADASQAAAMRAHAVGQIPRWRRILENSRLRENQRRAIVESRTLYLKDLRDYIVIGDDEFRRFVNLVADQEMTAMEAEYRCALDETCDVQAAMQGEYREHRRQVGALLGEERRQQIEDYYDNGEERNSIRYLRGMLPDNQPLSETQARELVTSLGAERRRFVQELLETGASPAAIYSLGTGATFPGTAQTAEEKLDAVQDYQRRMHARASGILNPAQLAVFTQIQQDLLASLRASWEFEAKSGTLP